MGAILLNKNGTQRKFPFYSNTIADWTLRVYECRKMNYNGISAYIFNASKTCPCLKDFERCECKQNQNGKHSIFYKLGKRYE